MLARLPEPEGFDASAREGPLVQIGRVVRRPWAVAVVGIAMVEGAVILGFLTFLAPSLEHDGFSPAVAGLAVGLYGLAVLGWTRAVKLVSDRLGPAALILIGGGMLALGYASGASGRSLAGVGAAALLVGGGFAFMHSTLQTWATEVVPEARHGDLALRCRFVRRQWGGYHRRGPAGRGRALRAALRRGGRGGPTAGAFCGSGASALRRVSGVRAWYGIPGYCQNVARSRWYSGLRNVRDRSSRSWRCTSLCGSFVAYAQK